MLIVADENIPLLDAFFEDIGEIRQVSGRGMTSEDVRDADILLVRSVTTVNRTLLEGSRVKFVGTATIGTDHVDLDYLAGAGITFGCAPGCNANSVVEYILSVLSLFAERSGRNNWTTLSVGIIGAGNVGGALWRTLDKLGFDVKVCDPPRAQDDEDSGTQFVSLDEALTCDVISLHTPLTRKGDYPTFHMMGAERLSKLTSEQLLINSSRGEVIDETALLACLAEPDAPLVALDVWENEPAVNPETLRQTWLASPHVAGYSLEGKVKGTEVIYRSLCRFLGLPARKQSGQFLPEPALSKLAFTSSAQAPDAASIAIRACYDPRRDDVRLRRLLTLDAPERSTGFDALRRDYPVRREFSSVKIQLKGTSRALQDSFKALGFKLKL
ncbi:4-phosphoerythronate dehydrogenase PdxB [Marinobacter caseinilyticus]|uniref:4-phosphoerythronate dehydrogenase PdxB n=1 Tax=Marinobacter caseinilyticus TaxID=2692195 RepID=UPI001409B247|nr:4-phosphoerythronate dehydrogenase PdxB [Marinobacter caseinilyticus]